MFLISHTYDLNDEYITGPYTPPPSEQLIFSDDNQHKTSHSDLIITPSFNTPLHLEELESKRGCYSLHIESRTADPVKTIKLTVLEGVEVGKAVRTLLKLLAWIKSTENDTTVSDFIKDQLSCRMEGLDKI